MPKHTCTKIEVFGTIGGRIWMPSVVCVKTFHYRSSDPRWSCNRHANGSKPTLREICLEATRDGDFQGAQIAEATVRITRWTTPLAGHWRALDIRRFASVTDCVVEDESDEYFEIMDACASGASG